MKPRASQQPESRVNGNSVGANSWMLLLASVALLHLAIQEGSSRPWVEWADLFVTVLIAFGAYLLFTRRRGDTAVRTNKRSTV